MKTGCVVLAAGNATRYGKNKLLACCRGIPMIQRTLDAVATELLARTVVVTQYDEIAHMAKAYGFEVLLNTHPEWGQSHSVHLGLTALNDCDAVMFQVADQPLLRRESVAALIAFHQKHPNNIVGLSYHGQRGNPCIFPAAYYKELLTIDGDHGGNVVIRRHPQALMLLETTHNELRDVDTPEQLQTLLP